MHHIHPAVEHGGLAEENPGAVRLEFGVHPLDALEEHHLHFPGCIGHYHGQPAGHIVLQMIGRKLHPILGVNVHSKHCGADLHIGLVRQQIGDVLEGTAVDVAERINVQKVSHRGNAKLAAKERGPLRPHSREVLYGGVHRHRHKKSNRTQ